MKDMPGMDNIQSMLRQMGMAGGAMPNLGRNTKIDVNAMQGQLNRMEKNAKMKENLKKKAEQKHTQKLAEKLAEKAAVEARIEAQKKNTMSEDELMAFFTNDKKEEKPKSSGKKKKGKK
jgi:hypothetical protein